VIALFVGQSLYLFELFNVPKMSGLSDEGDAALESPLADAAVSYLGFGATEDSASTPPPSFSHIRTLPIAVFHLVVLLAFEVEIFSNVFSDTRYRFILMQAILMAILVISHIIFRYEHSRMRYQGYLELYIKANNFTRVSFFFWCKHDRITIYYFYFPHRSNSIF